MGALRRGRGWHCDGKREQAKLIIRYDKDVVFMYSETEKLAVKLEENQDL